MWKTLTESDVLAALSAPETAAYQTAARGRGQNVLADIITQVVDECRAHIADCKHNTLAPGNTLPERVMFHAVVLIRYRLMTRLNLEVSEDRRKEQVQSVEFFRRVSECKAAIEPGDGTGAADDTAAMASPRPGIVARERNFSRGMQDGI